MAEVTIDNFWDMDLKDLPWALKMTDETLVVDSIEWIPFIVNNSAEKIEKVVGNK